MIGPKTTLFCFLIFCFCGSAFAQWPKDIKTTNETVITVYQPQPESMNGNKLEGRAAFSAKEKTGNDLLFGVFWFTATMVTDRDERKVTLESIAVNDVKLPGVDDTVK